MPRRLISVAGVLLVAAGIVGCARSGSQPVGAGPASAPSATTSSSYASPEPASSASTMSPAVTLLEAQFNSADDRIVSSVELKGSFYLERPASAATRMTAAEAIAAAFEQPALAQLPATHRDSAIAKLALFSQVRPTATDVPEAAIRSQSLSWVVLVLRVPDRAGRSSGRAPGPEVTPTTRRTLTVDLVTILDAATGVAGGTYALG